MNMKEFKKDLKGNIEYLKNAHESLLRFKKLEENSNGAVDKAFDDVSDAINELNLKAFDIERKQRKLQSKD